MMNYEILSKASVLLGLAIILLAGCARSPSTKFYVLDSLSNSELEQEFAPSRRGFTIGVGPVRLPKYLDRPQIVTRLSRNELQLAEFHQWAEPLGQNFSRVLAENLSLMSPADRVVVFPWNHSTAVDFQVTVEILRFETRVGRESALTARWNIFKNDGKKLVMTDTSNFREIVTTQDYETMVSAKSQVVAALSREVAMAITALTQTPLGR